jgi:hypothetical protein
MLVSEVEIDATSGVGTATDTLYSCANCQRTIGALEQPYQWGQHIVCSTCLPALRQAATQEPPPQSRPQRLQPQPKYNDVLYIPRLSFLFIAIILTALTAAGSHPEGERPDFTFPYIMWGAWIAVGIVSIVRKANWKERNRR